MSLKTGGSSSKSSKKSVKSPKKDDTFGKIINNRFKIGESFGSGSFGELRFGVDLKINDLVAIKLEEIDSKMKEKQKVNGRGESSMGALELEHKCYKTLGTSFDGFPKVFYYGQITGYNAMVMELLGKNLDSMFVQCGRQFSMKTIIYIFIQLLQRIERVHNCNIVYRDIKPENFVLGREGSPKKENIIHIIDFGLSKQYNNPETGKHIPMKKGQQLTGTARYMSINSLIGKEQSRRDDLESIGYLIMYFVKQGKLPWSGLKTDKLKERWKRIGIFKRGTPIENLCYGYPEPFADYFRYVRQLEFEEKPNYQFLKNMFIRLFEKENYEDDGLYDWN